MFPTVRSNVMFAFDVMLKLFASMLPVTFKLVPVAARGQSLAEVVALQGEEPHGWVVLRVVGHRQFRLQGGARPLPDLSPLPLPEDHV